MICVTHSYQKVKNTLFKKQRTLHINKAEDEEMLKESFLSVEEELLEKMREEEKKAKLEKIRIEHEAGEVEVEASQETSEYEILRQQNIQ